MLITRPSSAFEDSYRNYIAELGDEERYPFPLDFDHSDFRGLLARLERFRKGIDLDPVYVPASTFWLVDGSDICGVSNLRHHLNDSLRHVGGHIGLGIRPSRRGQGLGSVLLGLTIEKARDIGISEVHVHCHKSNEPSARMILSQGGVLESEVNDGGVVVQRYRVHTEASKEADSARRS